jgi:hypothetical protein
MYVTHIGLYDHYASFVKEEEKFNMCFANDMQNLHTIYLFNSKQIKIISIASLVLVGFWCLWR